MVQLLTGDVVGLGQGPQTTLWGLYQNGQPVITANSVVEVSLRVSSTISSYPVEQGAFQSYDKVQKPFEGRLRFATGGSVADRTALLASVDAAKLALTPLYDLYMPEQTYHNVNVVDYEFDRKALSGVGLFVVDVSVQEVRPTGNVQFAQVGSPGGTQLNNGQDPGSNDPLNGGVQQGQQASQSQAQAVNNILNTMGAGF